ncbi:ATP-binding protein, partial [Echinicola sediminis]
VIVSLVRNILARIISEGNDSFKRHNITCPLISINLSFDSAPKGFREINFSADVPKLTALVMGRELYGENANVIFIRELIQNSIDAIRARMRLDKKKFAPIIHISYSEQTNTFVVEDNGVGMSKIEAESYLLKVGRSIWRSKRLNKNDDLSPSSIGRFGIGFVSALYVSKQIRVSTKRYSLNSNPFGLVIRSVEKPVYVDDKAEKSDIGTKIEVHLTEKLNSADFNTQLKNFFLFHPEGIKFDNQLIPTTPEESLLLTYKNGFSGKFNNSFLLGNQVHSIKLENAQLNYIIPSPSIIENWNSQDQNSCIITNGCVFVSSTSIHWGDPVLQSMNLLNKGLFILSLKEGKYNISARRNKIEIPNEIVSELNDPLAKTINDQYLSEVKTYSDTKDFFYKEPWRNIKKVFDDTVIINNSDQLKEFCLELTVEGKDPKLVPLEKINQLQDYNLLDSSIDIFDSTFYRIYKYLKPNVKFILIRISNRDHLLRSLISHNIRNMSSSDFRKKIYSENLIPEVSGHPLTKYLTEYTAISNSDFFVKNSLGGLFFVLQNHPSIEQIGMKRNKKRRATNPCVYINEGHPWTICMSKIDSIKLNEEKQLKVEQLIYWVLRSRGDEQKNYLDQLAELPKKLGLTDKIIPL